MGGDRIKCGDRFEREIDQKKSLRTAVLRYGLPAGSHFIFYSPVCIPTMHGGKRGFFYIWAGKSHPRERTTEWPVFLLIIFICLFCSLCSSSKALSHHDAQQFFKADSGAACCIAGSDGASVDLGALALSFCCSWAQQWKMTFNCCSWPRDQCVPAPLLVRSVVVHHLMEQVLLLMIPLKKSIILNRHCLMLIPSVSKSAVPGVKRNWLS